MLVILLNCITLGMYQPCIDDLCDTYRCQILSKFDDAIFAFFTIEMMIKMIAMGITGKGAYLADTWNRLDFFIVAAGVVEYCLVMESTVNLSAIRTIRVLRPLRAINRIPSMRILVMLLLDTLPMLGNVLLLCFFVFFIFGIVGVQLWKGMLRQRCFLPENMTHYGELFYPDVPRFFRFQPRPITNYYNATEQEKDYICSLPKDNGMHACDNLPPTKHKDNSSVLCMEPVQSLHLLTEDSCINWNQYYTECREGDENPFQGTISFDNIGSAWVAIFLVISLEGWTDIMYYIQDAHSFWDWIYFVLLIVIGSFFMINLCLVVIATQFSETKKREIERMKQERARFQSTSTLASGSMSEQASCYTEIVKYIAHLFRRGKNKLRVRYLQYKRKWRGDRPSRSQRKKRRRKDYEYQGEQIAPGENIIFPSANYSSSPLTIYRNVVGTISPPTIITPPEIMEPSSLPANINLSPPTNVGLNSSDVSSDAESLTNTRRPALLQLPSGAETLSYNDYLSPSTVSGGGLTPRRRRSSVMFSDVVLLHGNLSDSSTKNNICLSEKTTQTEPEEPLDPSMFLSNPQSKTSLRPPSSKASSHQDGRGSLTCGELLALSGALSAALPAHLGVDAQSVQTLYSSLAKGVKHFSAPSLFYSEKTAFKTSTDSSPSDSFHSESDWSDDDWSDEEEESSPSKITLIFIKARQLVRAIVEHRYFQRGILIAILINTLSMGVEYHNQPDWLTQVVELSNLIFSAIFAFEMFLKVVAEGPFGYISNGFNLFDGIIVILSIIEMYESHVRTGEHESNRSSLSVLRTFRLLRILKLVRFMPQLRRQLFVMLRTMDNVAIFFSLLILFIFIFSILGMNLFGCKFCSENSDKTVTCDRKNFDSLLWASITVFQILTQEDWNIVLFNGMEKTSHWASLYFVALMTFGNYVLFNLLVAILVEGFSAERRERLEKEEKKKERQREKRRMQAIREYRDTCDEFFSDGENSKSEERKAFDSDEGSQSGDCRSIFSSEEGYCMALKVTNPHSVKDSPTKEEKKRSRLSLENVEDEKRMMKTNEERLKENQLRQLMLYDEPKCNIEKENQLLQLPRAQQEIERSIVHTSPVIGCSNSLLSQPPIITHTAATPQGSPHTTLDSNRNYEINNRLSPSMALKGVIPVEEKGQGLVCRSSSIKSNNASICSRTSRSSCRMGLELVAPRRDSLSPNDAHNISSITPTGSFRDRSHSSGGGGGGGGATPWRRGSSSRRKRLHSNSSSGSKRQNDCQSLVNDSGSEGEEETTLNNNVSFNNLNNLLPSPSGIDHSHCNGSMGAGGVLGGGPRRSILTQQNSIGSPGILSPQNSIRSARSRKHSAHGGQIMFGVTKEFKTTNLELAAKDTQLETECSKETDEYKLQKLFWVFKPPPVLIKRKEYSLFIFSPTNPIRRLCSFLISQKWFDSSILVFIGLNCITLAMERPNIPPDSGERFFLRICNDLFTVVFGIEMLLKVIGQGLVYGAGAYFSSRWNIMDGILVIISVVDILMALIATTSSRIFGILRVFRLLRALRPLRVINRAPGLKLVVQTLLSSLQPIGNIVLICCTFFIIFGILGVQLFKGAFFYCEGEDVTGIKTRQDCEMVRGYRWTNHKYNFDNLGQALMALFVLSSKDGWVNIMYTGLDAVGVDKQPKKNYSQWRLLYFISFLLLVGFFVLNMFVGVVVENFHRCREEQEKEERARRAEKRAKKIEKKRKKLREPPYYSDYGRTRLFIFNMVTSKYFDLAIAAVIGLNVITMALEFYEMPLELDYALQIFNYFFTAVFILECVMKVVALGCRRYIKDNEESRWNQLDILIVILSVVGIVLEEMKNEIIPINPTIIRVMRVLRIARVLKLLKMAKGIRALLDTVMQALPQVGNLGLLFFLLFFIFAALGVELFGRLECDDDHPCQGLGEHAHFKNFGMAFLTLFRVATGDNWNGIMKDTLREECSYEPGCVKNCCLYPFVAPIFFVVFVLMAQFVLVNVVVAVLMKHLEESHKQVQMEDEFDLDVEIERQIAQEEEDMAEMQENLTNLKLAQEKMKSIQQLSSNIGKDELPTSLRVLPFQKPIRKVPSLPDNFMFYGHRASDPLVRYNTGSPFTGERKGAISYKIPSINISGSEPRRRESVQVTMGWHDKRNPYLHRKSLMAKDVNLPRLRLEGFPSPSVNKTQLYLGSSSSKSLLRRDSPKEMVILRGLSREGSKRVKIDLKNDAPREDGAGQRQRQMKWHDRRKSSSGSSYKISMEDSVSQSLMASFEIAGKVDMDSTSCSVCSSEDVSNLSSAGLGICSGHNSSSPKHPKPIKLHPMAPVVKSIEQMFEDDDATIASSTDSLTIESVPPDPSSCDSDSLSEAAANLPIPPSPPFPRRQDRQVRSVHGIRPRPRPSHQKVSLSSSLNELPQRTRGGSLTTSGSAIASAVSAPHSPTLQRRTIEHNLKKCSLSQTTRRDSPCVTELEL